MNWLFRMSQWARNPPSAKRVRLVFAVVAICFVIYGFEVLFGWPEALTVDRRAPHRIPVSLD